MSVMYCVQDYLISWTAVGSFANAVVSGRQRALCFHSPIRVSATAVDVLEGDDTELIGRKVNAECLHRFVHVLRTSSLSVFTDLHLRYP